MIDGITFDSKGESERWLELKLLEKSNKITDLRRQISFELIPKVGKQRAINYVADFVYMQNGKEIVEDFKGFKTSVYKLKRKLFYWRYGKEILET